MPSAISDSLTVTNDCRRGADASSYVIVAGLEVARQAVGQRRRGVDRDHPTGVDAVAHRRRRLALDADHAHASVRGRGEADSGASPPPPTGQRW